MAERLDIYLAGKVRGNKVAFAQGVDKHLTRNVVYWHRSDGDSHSEHEWGFSAYSYNSESMKEWMREAFVESVVGCDLLIAYLDTPDSFGTIAEIAYASSIGKQCYVLIADTSAAHPFERCPYAGHCGECDRPNKMYDAYWFVSHLPNVTSVLVRDLGEAIFTGVQICSLGSPIEHKLCQAFYQYEWFAFVPQCQIGKYYADFAFSLAKIVVEVDGHDWHSSKEQRGRDAQRDRFLQSEGWQVLRYTGTEIYADPRKCAREIIEAVKKAHSNTIPQRRLVAQGVTQ